MLRLLDWLEESETRGEWYAKQRRRVLKFVKVKRMSDEYGRHRSHRALITTSRIRLVDYADMKPESIAIPTLLRKRE